jgi:L-aminopeptidase/D-esterase-like protein
LYFLQRPGLERAGYILADSSGDLFLAFSTANRDTDNGNSNKSAALN